MKKSKFDCVLHVDETGQEFQGLAMLFEYTYEKHTFWFGVAHLSFDSSQMAFSGPGSIKIEDGRTGNFHFKGFKIEGDYIEVGFIGCSPLYIDPTFQSDEEKQKTVREFFDQCYMLMHGNHRIINPLIHFEGFNFWYEYLAAASDGKIQRSNSNTCINWATSESTASGLIVEFQDSETQISKMMRQVSVEQQERFDVLKTLCHEDIEKVLIEINNSRPSF